MDVDASGNVYIGGAFQDVVDFDPGAGVTSLTSLGLVNAYTLKLNSSGNLLWVCGVCVEVNVNRRSILVKLSEIGRAHV